MSAGPQVRPATSGTPRLTPALVAVAVVAVLAVSGASMAGGWALQPRGWIDGAAPSSVFTPPIDPPAQPTPLGEANPLQQWIAGALAALVGLAALAGVLWLARWLWRRRPRRAVVEESEPESTPEGVVAAEPHLPALARGATTAEGILAQAGGVPRDMILRCWLALENAAAASGVPRRPSASPTEFTATVLRSTPADRAPVDTLLHLYHRARFSDHPVTDDDVRAARTAVIALARRWRGYDTAMRHTTEADG